MSRQIVPGTIYQIKNSLSHDQRRHTFFAYDNFGALTEARFDSAASAYGLFFGYDALGRVTQEQNTVSGTARTIDYQYDTAGRRTRLTWPDGKFVTYSYDDLSRPTGVWRQGTDAVRSWTYNAKGQLAAMGPGFDSQFVYEDSGRLFQQSDYGSDSSSWSYNRYSYNAAGQVEEEQSWYDNAIWDGHQPVTTPYTANGLNQYTVVVSKNYTYDANGNLTADGTDTFTYDPANRLIAMPSKGASLAYDPLGRLDSVTDASGTERFLYDGNALIAEYNVSGTMLRRHVHGLSAGDDPLASYSGSLFDASNEQLIRQDRLGSITHMSTDRATATVNVNTYDEYGVPGSGNVGRFQYTGQVWLEQLGLYHYKARTYSPTLGRFLQTDPIGYGDGLNMYAYVGNDPLNGIDPFGLKEGDECTTEGGEKGRETADGGCAIRVTITGSGSGFGGFAGGGGGFGGGGSGGSWVPDEAPEDVPEQNRVVIIGEQLDNADLAAALAILNAGGGSVEYLPAVPLNNRIVIRALIEAKPKGSALKNDYYHNVANFVLVITAYYGKHSLLKGADGNTHHLYQILGSRGGEDGRFEFIVDHNGNLSHRRFVPGGGLNGQPNRP